MLQRIGHFASKTFLLWVLLVSVIAFTMPSLFSGLGAIIPYLLGIVMLGMGLTIKVSDFKLIFKYPKPVLIGVALQYTVMPVLAYLIAKAFQLPPDIAIGVILVGCCPGGTTSNVMSYIAKANVALSVTITSVSTMLAPVLTPSFMYLFAREWMEVSFASMFMSVTQVVLVPILIGLVVQRFFRGFSEKSEDVLPLVSVVAISLILGTVVAGSRELIIETGLLIFTVVVLHNVLGYATGYVLANVFKLDYPDKKAVSIEVGMQNSGLAVSLAIVHFNPLAAVSGAVFSFVHCVTGPLLARFWAKRAERAEQENRVETSHGSLA
ncbi:MULTISPECIES: bile acid:sodium symporter family protein [unclassified Staphylococcus]|uniref:bile acid:sodium symporter family protein n=1 Tax=unclassified Staphylococcus TaxID=91994 RepID=UPI0021CEB326|nr:MULTISPECIES: bile acid:sodium symporter family protein [unclassified Staphylococcus]UXR73659.1 bile acid:sodium symporter family protein [Staphylococcus sp. IVB6238]UXR75976.1 bile acid:sodium symporter family protein [Staphylococcus sp. IVB6233]UXR80173.1 bile acid:sodium symporter family protein [Staphylococcus sp. IVB6218]